MNKVLSIVFVLALILTAKTNAGVDLGVSFDEEGLKDFHIAISSHYKVDGRDIEIAHRKSIPDEELPVLFFIAKHAGKDYNTILKLRIGGKSWVEICNRYALSPSLFYVELNNPGPPYGKAYGHYKNKKKEPSMNSFSDADIVNFINLKFASDYYHCDPNYVAELRAKGRGFIEIQNSVKQQKHNQSEQAKADKKKSNNKNKKRKK